MTEERKSFLRLFRADMRLLAHLLLVPVRAALQAVIRFLTHIDDEAAKV